MVRYFARHLFGHSEREVCVRLHMLVFNTRCGFTNNAKRSSLVTSFEVQRNKLIFYATTVALSVCNL